MLDSSSDFSQNTSYKQMSDVITDLHLMIEKPSIYLHDFDMTHLSTTGLQLDKFHMRDEEFASLQRAYQRSEKWTNELVLISGEAGSGKSFMVERLGRDITSSGRHFVSVKFGQLKSANPLSALTSAFSHYCTLLIEENDNDLIQSMAAKLQTAFERHDLFHLAKMMPKLSDILDIDLSSANYSDQDCVNGQGKVHYLLTAFVKVISSCSKVTVTLWLDDCQWADLFSLTVLVSPYRV
jgi:predicted ATPase